jgi:hypothetical protein
MLAWLYAGAPAVPQAWVQLHASLQVFGFFATLIAGVAPHLVARFTGRPLVWTRLHRRLAALLGLALALRVAGTVADLGAVVLGGAALQAIAFGLFTRWVWRALDPPPLAIVRRQLALSSAWLVVALLVELLGRVLVLRDGGTVPAGTVMRAVHTVALDAGVLGWVLGVMLRAGPMFIAGWQPRPSVARVLPVLLAVGAVLTWVEAFGNGPVVVGRFGELVAFGGGVALLVTAGAFRHVPKALPMLSRSGEETRIARIALVSFPLAALGAAATVVGALAGANVHVVADAVRHLVAVGFVTSIVVAMTFRLIPALEAVSLRWPGLRRVALVALAAAVALRTAQVLVPLGAASIAPAVALSGLLVWIAVASVAASFVAAVRRRAA